MTFHPLAMAEIKKRHADLLLEIERLDLKVPGTAQSLSERRRYARCNRLRAMAADYAWLIKVAEER